MEDQLYLDLATQMSLEALLAEVDAKLGCEASADVALGESKPLHSQAQFDYSKSSPSILFMRCHSSNDNDTLPDVDDVPDFLEQSSHDSPPRSEVIKKSQIYIIFILITLLSHFCPGRSRSASCAYSTCGSSGVACKITCGYVERGCI